MEKVRIAWLDVTKGILILFVLLSHSSAPNIYIRFFAPFFLTMFFFVSGYTFSVKDSFRTFIIGKIKRLFVPLISMGGIKLVLACILQGDSFPERVKGLLFQTSGKNDDLWFLGCMITATIMFYFVVRLAELWKEQRRIPVIVMLSAFLSLLGWCSILVLNAKWPWQLENALVMIFYMSMGYAYRRHESYVVNNIERKNLVVLGLGILYFIMFLTFDGSADIHKGIYTMPGAYIAMSFIAIPVLTSISKWISEFSGGGNYRPLAETPYSYMHLRIM